MRNFACLPITASLCVLLLMVAGCFEDPMSTESEALSDGQAFPISGAVGGEEVEDQPETAQTQVGDTFTISLPSNPTTGYSWELDFDADYLELVSDDFVITSNLFGAPGIQSFELKAINQGRTELTMIYKRSWEDQVAEKRVMLVQIAGRPS